MGRIEELIELLGMRRHPEGGYYAEVYRSPVEVAHSGKTRKAVSAIYFLLPRGEVSRPHRILSDELWHVYEGELELVWADEGFHRTRLGRVREGVKAFAVVPAGAWQAARPLSEYALAGCTVSPAFEWDEFELAEGEVLEGLLERFPEFKEFV
ncbi:cupin domain-containing protein [Thermococcus sp. 21S7]|uniref:cupin domain-containing protein n=1 Tax=Thermococcus sp. 21S7 TaxID=1638221 RepID=UPI00143A835C|nr:cupin domain-containing protein [Thermococcus sp. 21S7]NJE60666.1 cupin domain-containing protein [Thermococcus sp. 21S7]